MLRRLSASRSPNPALIAISSDGSAGSNGNVANLSATLTNGALPSGQTPATPTRALSFRWATTASNATRNRLRSETTCSSSRISRVRSPPSSTDEETTNLIKFQTAYEAAARIVSTMQAAQYRDPRYGHQWRLLTAMRVNPNMVPDMLAAIQQSQTTLNRRSSRCRPARASMCHRTILPPLPRWCKIRSRPRRSTSTRRTLQACFRRCRRQDSALSSVVSSLTQAVSLGTEGANGTSSTANQQRLPRRSRASSAALFRRPICPTKVRISLAGRRAPAALHCRFLFAFRLHLQRQQQCQNSVQVGDRPTSR
jgi:hypothetical protein